MWSLNFDWINGMMLGIEFPQMIAIGDDEDDEVEVAFTVQLDLLILRVVIMRLRQA
jgi:hypothetical protein